jgi:predicted DsbA family dithiol-disulfide isomerase
LIDAGAAGGLSETRVRAMLDSDEGIAQVRAQLGQAQALGIQAVPTFVFDGRMAVQGAQTPEVFKEVFARLGVAAAAATDPAGAACGPDGCAI